MDNKFLTLLAGIAELYGKQINEAQAGIYWEILKDYSINDIDKALLSHAKDPDRGRFFPKPADIIAKMPDKADAWLSANEAWATCPKDENASAAMCDEISQALYVVQDLINEGDLIAARMGFIEYYNRVVGDAKREGRTPKWYPSYGMDKESRYLADRQVVERVNLVLPNDKKLSLPEPESVKGIEYKYTAKLESDCSPKKASEYLSSIKNMLGDG